MELPDPILNNMPNFEQHAPFLSVLVSLVTLTQIGCLVWFFNLERLMMCAKLAVGLYVQKSIGVALVPLRVPWTHVLIHDYVTDRLVGLKRGFRNDLFISGHLYHALIVLHYVPRTHRLIPYVACCLTCFILLVTKTHYTIDLVMSLVCFWISLQCI